MSDVVVLPDCKRCDLDGKPAKSKGSIPATFLFVGEAPSEIEHKMRNVFTGQGGTLLNATLKEIGISQKECYFTNVLGCAPKAQPKVGQIRACMPRLQNEIERVQPKVIVALGTWAVKALLDRKDNIAELRGYTFWSKEYNCYVIPTYHPNAIVHNPGFFDDFAKDLQKVKEAQELPPGGIKQEPLQWYMVKSPRYAIRIFEAISRMQNAVISFDIETDGFDYFVQDILCIGISTSDNSALTFPKHVIENPRVQEAMGKAFANKGVTWVAQNGKFDVQYLRANPDPKVFGKQKKVVVETARCDYDTMLAHYECDERQGTHGLKRWAREEFDAEDYDSALAPYLPNKNTPYSAVPEHILHKYLAYDAVYTRKGYFRFNDKMKKEGTDGCFWNVLMPASQVLTEIELHGTLLDVPMLKRLMEEAEPKIAEAGKKLEHEAVKAGWSPEAYVAATGAKEKPKFFNPRSHPQMSWVAYDLCKVPLFEGKKTCNKDAVEAYQYKHPFWKALAEYKQVADLFGTYIKGMLERVDKDGRIRPDFFIIGTVTGRLSCHDPNLQNIPRKSFAKDLFIAPEDSVIVNCDYKTLEVVVAAILSEDEEMQRPFIHGEDFHMNTTRDVFAEDLANFKEWKATKNVKAFIKYLKRPMMLEVRIPGYKYIYDSEDYDDESTYRMKAVEEIDFDKLEDMLIDYLRFLTKFVTFGIMYGRKAPSLANGELNCSVVEAQKYIDNFHKKYKGFSRWMKKMEDQALKQGYVQTAFGHKRRWQLITNDLIYAIKNQAVNTPIQGTAAQICLLALVRIHNAFKENGFGHVLFTVHDSIVFEVKKKHLQEALTMIRDMMQQKPLDTDVPFTVDVEVGERYGKVEGVVCKDGKWVPAKPHKASEFVKEVLGYQA